MRSRTVVMAASCALTVLFSGVAMAEKIDAHDHVVEYAQLVEYEPNERATTPPARSGLVQGLGLVVPEGQLNSLRGGTSVPANFTHVRNENDVSGSVFNNAAVNVVTGNNTVGMGSFANASGLPIVIQNSGNNVLIQNATILNLQMK